MAGKLIAGNWKMNGLRGGGLDLARAVAAGAGAGPPGCELLICPPATLLLAVAEALAGSAVALGGQDCHAIGSGAHTGDISAAMLADAGCRYVIVGHSERRGDHGETSGQIRDKAAAALAADLTPIVCVGETERERDEGRTLEVIEGQVRGSLPELARAQLPVIAYEPVWAIGTGKVATAGDVAEVHARIRGLLAEVLGAGSGPAVRILYGGSVKPVNAAELLAVDNVDGALVGGASLKAEDFLAITANCP